MKKVRVNTLNAGQTLKGAVRVPGSAAYSVGRTMRDFGNHMRVFKKGKR